MSIGIESNINPSRPDPEWGEKINLDFFSHFFAVSQKV